MHGAVLLGLPVRPARYGPPPVGPLSGHVTVDRRPVSWLAGRGQYRPSRGIPVAQWYRLAAYSCGGSHGWQVSADAGKTAPCSRLAARYGHRRSDRFLHHDDRQRKNGTADFCRCEKATARHPVRRAGCCGNATGLLRRPYPASRCRWHRCHQISGGRISAGCP